jgi:4-methyl-5(b-hydroxyethyl)-thiazole monophosphate biosynthesis
MSVFLFLAEGFEETEAVTTIDILRRGNVDVTTVSVTGKHAVAGAHGIPVVADQLFDATDFSKGAMLVLPGGMPGAKHLNEHEGLRKLILQYDKEGKGIAAICAAPIIPGGLNLLQNKRATVYPGYEESLAGAIVTSASTVKDGNIITAKGPGSVFDFGLAIVTELAGQEKANEIAVAMLIKGHET